MKKLKTSKNFATNKLKIPKKQVSAAIAFALMLTIAATIGALPIVSAHTPAWNVATFAFISVWPNPIGVGQTVNINMWLDKVPPTAFWIYGDKWYNFKIEVTKPDGTVDTLGPFTSDDIGGYHISYTPDTVGTYYVQFFFPGQTIAGINPDPVTGTQTLNRLAIIICPATAQKWYSLCNRNR